MNEVLYNQQEAEAMLCLWEVMLEERYFCMALSKQFTTYGAVFMRFEAMEVSKQYLKVWERFTPDERSGILYDREFWPAVVHVHDWLYGHVASVDQIREHLNT